MGSQKVWEREENCSMKLTSKSRLTPLGARFLVKPVQEDNMYGDIIIKPDTAKDKPVLAMVVAVGDGKQDTNFTGKWPPVSAGEHVLYGRWAGHEIRVDDQKEEEWLRVISVEEILAVVIKV